jgi:hypothetical protein
MIDMFKIIDDTFINLWNRVHNTHASAAWFTQVQTQLSEAVPAHLECTDVQGVQIRITQQWLRSQAWQLGVCQGRVSSVPNDAALTFKYPIEIAGGLLTISHQFPQQALDAHGAGLVSDLVFPTHHSFSILEFISIRAHLSMQQSVTLRSISVTLDDVYS